MRFKKKTNRSAQSSPLLSFLLFYSFSSFLSDDVHTKTLNQRENQLFFSIFITLCSVLSCSPWFNGAALPFLFSFP